MSRTINRVELLGRVGIDPEMTYTPNGTPVTRLRLATDRYRKNAEDATDWHTVKVWGKQGEAVNRYVNTGQRLFVAGRLVQNSWDGEDGRRRYSTEVHAQEVVFLDHTATNGTSEDTSTRENGSPF